MRRLWRLCSKPPCFFIKRFRTDSPLCPNGEWPRASAQNWAYGARIWRSSCSSSIRERGMDVILFAGNFNAKTQRRKDLKKFLPQRHRAHREGRKAFGYPEAFYVAKRLECGELA